MKRFQECFLLSKFETSNISNDAQYLLGIRILIHENIKHRTAVKVADLSLVRISGLAIVSMMQCFMCNQT